MLKRSTPPKPSCGITSRKHRHSCGKTSALSVRKFRTFHPKMPQFPTVAPRPTISLPPFPHRFSGEPCHPSATLMGKHQYVLVVFRQRTARHIYIYKLDNGEVLSARACFPLLFSADMLPHSSVQKAETYAKGRRVCWPSSATRRTTPSFNIRNSPWIVSVPFSPSR